MTDPRPAPMIPAECRLDKLPFMPVVIDNLLNSDLWQQSSGDEFKAAFALWVRSWKQEPGGSLPSNDRILSGLAGVSLSQWRKLKEMALHRWVECDDGRLYHPFVARKALEAWIERVRYQKRSAKGNRQRGHSVKSDEEFDAEIERAIEYLRRLDPESAGAKRAVEAISEQGDDGTPSRSSDQVSEQGDENAPKHKHKHKLKHKIEENPAPAPATAEDDVAAAGAVAGAGRSVWKARLKELHAEHVDVLVSSAEGIALPDALMSYADEGFSWAHIRAGIDDFLTIHRARKHSGRIGTFAHPGIREHIEKRAAAANPTARSGPKLGEPGCNAPSEALNGEPS